PNWPFRAIGRAMFGLGMGELIVILVVALIVLGPAKLPKLASDLGKAIRDFRRAADDVKKDFALDEDIRKPFEELREAVTLSPGGAGGAERAPKGRGGRRGAPASDYGGRGGRSSGRHGGKRGGGALAERR